MILCRELARGPESVVPPYENEEVTCANDDCDHPARYKSSGLCRRCHDQAKQQGALPVIYTRGWTIAQKLAHFRIVPEDPDGCYGWRGHLYVGYGHFWVDGRRGAGKAAHRIAYEAEVGPIPEGYHVDHVCHNRDLSCPGGPTCLHRQCTRTDHLRAVPRLQNNQSARIGERPGGKQRKTHCKYGHELAGDNLYVNPSNGERSCRACNRAKMQSYQKRRKARLAAT